MRYLIAIPLYSYAKDKSNVYVTFGHFVLTLSTTQEEWLLRKEIRKRYLAEHKRLREQQNNKSNKHTSENK